MCVWTSQISIRLVLKTLSLHDLFRSTAYSSPLVSFEGKMVIPKDQIRLPVQIGLDVVEVDFIIVVAFSPYTTIMDRLWLHTLGAISSTFHQKVKYPSRDQVFEIVGS